LTTLTEEQYIVVKQYSDLLNTVEEAFQYIIESFDNYERTEGDILLADVFSAFGQIAETNEQQAAILPTEINQFDDVVKTAELLVDAFDNQGSKQQIIREKLYPAFSAWNGTMQEKLKPLYTV
jgi:hypothetical protein